MKKNIAVVCCLASFSLVAAPKPDQPWQTANKTKDEMWKQGKTCEQIIDALEKMRGETHYATNAYTRAYIDRMIVYLCRRPGWTGLKRWNINLEQRIPGTVRRTLDDDEVGFGQKIELAALLAEYLAGEKQFDEAEKVVRTAMQAPGKRVKYEDAKGYFALADVYRWQDRFEEAWQAIDKAFELDPKPSVGKAYQIAKDTRDEKDFARADAMAEKIADPSARIDAYEYAGRKTDKTRKLVLDYIRNSQNDARRRAGLALYWFAADREHPNERAAAFAALKAIDMAKANVGISWNCPLNTLFWHADWEGVEEVFKAFDGTKGLAEPRWQRQRLISLAALGRKEEALALIATNLTNEALKPVDRVKFEVTKALLTGADVGAVVAAAKLERKDEIAVVLTAARQALTFNLGEVTEKLAAKYSAYFVDFGQREMKVTHAKTPISSIADWRKLYGTLDRQVCDRKFGANLDALETDVATGRKAVEKTTLDSADAQMEVSAVSDVNGVHVFLRVEDPNARKVESGFAGGIGTEMYFAPGKYEPYICFGSDPRTGVEHAFQTTYTYADHKRIDVEGRSDKRAFRSETAFTDTDYVLHLYFAWDTFYQKLPKNGSKWRFECIAFGPKGPYSLGGSENVHNSSKFCDLVFDLKPEDITAIRRGLICRHVKSWAKLGHLDRFDKWADVEIGDPEFYNAVLKPIETELKGYAREVSADMSAEDVNRIFEKGLVRWLGISHEIDALRRTWLQDSLCK